MGIVLFAISLGASLVGLHFGAIIPANDPWQWACFTLFLIGVIGAVGSFITDMIMWFGD